MLLIVHGGAGNRMPSKRALKVLSEALSEGYALLRSGRSSLDAVIAAVAALENSGVFNAGAGGNLQLDGVRRLDASVMEGRRLMAGSVVGLEGVRNPIRVARLVMDLPHVMLTDTGARRIADRHHLASLPEPDEKSLTRLRAAQKRAGGTYLVYRKYFSTVGAVAIDRNGDLAAGASTGGIAAMLPGRVGDTPIIGAGVYAENSFGAVSCTGTGECIMRLSLAKEICMKMHDSSPLQAGISSLRRIIRMGGQAGVIVIDRSGRFAILHTTGYMAGGYIDGRGPVVRAAFRKTG